MTVAERFWKRVDRAAPGECWEWLGARTHRGYGTVRFKRDGRWTTTTSHRFAYMLTVGPLPEGHALEVDHLCRNRACVNPAHLEAVTPAENNRRSVRHFPKEAA